MFKVINHFYLIIMKKRSLKELNLSSSDVLKRDAMKSILGGYDEWVRFTFTYSDGTPNYVQTVDYMGSGDCSSWANQQCVSALSSNPNMSHCYFDCSGDGFGY